MGKRNHTPKADYSQQTPNRRRSARSRPVTNDLPVPRSVPEDIATDRGYVALQISGLSDLMRSAAAEDHLSPEAVFFVTTALDDLAVRLTR